MIDQKKNFEPHENRMNAQGKTNYMTHPSFTCP